MTRDKYPAAIEMPVELWINSKLRTTFMASPYDLEDLGVGHILSRGMLASIDDIEDIEVREDSLQIFVKTKHDTLEELYSVPNFVLSGSSSVSKFNDNIYKIPKVHGDFSIELSKVVHYANIMVEDAPIYHETGGVHSSILVDSSTDKYYLREDIGRHSAVDKAIGAAARDGADFSSSFICTSGRISLDMLLKSAAMGIGLVASLKFPSHMGVELADFYQISILAKILGKEPLIYTGRKGIK